MKNGFPGVLASLRFGAQDKIEPSGDKYLLDPPTPLDPPHDFVGGVIRPPPLQDFAENLLGISYNNFGLFRY